MGCYFFHKGFTNGFCVLFFLFMIMKVHCQEANATYLPPKVSTSSPTAVKSTSLTSRPRRRHGCIFLVEMTMNFSMACSYCEDNNSQLYDIDHLVKQPLPNNSYKEVLVKYGKLWTEPCIDQSYHENNCTYFVQEGDHIAEESTACSTALYFVCYINDTNDSRCQSGSNFTTAAGIQTSPATSGNILNVTETASPLKQELLLTIILAVAGVFVILVLIAIAVGIYIIKRHGNPIKYAVGEENPHTVDVSPGHGDEATTSRELDTHQPEEPYNTLELRKVNGTRSGVQGDESNPKIYDHLRRNENEYDTTCLHKFDTRTVDKTYARTYFGSEETMAK